MVQWLYSFIMQYKRVFVPGGIYFFTVITYMRCPIFSDENAVNLFKDSLIQIKRKHPFTLDAIVILPDHIHTIWTLPKNDANYPTRWRLIKSHFSHAWTNLTKISLDKPVSRVKKNENTIWQRRYWEHAITSLEDYNLHLDYILYNPIKHGYVNDLDDWRYSYIRNE